MSLNFSNLEKNYGETFSAKTKNILQKIYDKELNYDTKNTSSAKQILEELVKFCKGEGISQEAISSLELESSLTNVLPSRTINGGAQFQGETSESVRLSYLDNLGTTKTLLRQKQNDLLEEKLAAAEREEKEIDQVIVAGGDRIESKKQDNKELEEDNKELEEDNKELKEENAKIKEILSDMSKLQIDYRKYAPFLLKEKGE